MVTCAFVEWSEGLHPTGAGWDSIRRAVESVQPDILITNELPFGAWLAHTNRFDTKTAERSVALHEQGVEVLGALEVTAVISSRPVWAGDRLANEAFALEGGKVRTLHRKQFFPNEDGWYESAWFHADAGGFVVHAIAGVTVGVLLCTELMFNDHARHYGSAGAELIVVPRATGDDHQLWATAGAMAAIVSGSYVVSSNRTGSAVPGPAFGGRGMAFAPDGMLLAETSSQKPLAVIDLSLEISRRQKAEPLLRAGAICAGILE